MTPDALGTLVDRYGLPVVILAGFLWLLMTRRLVLGSEANFIDARRIEEREGRIAAEARVVALTEAVVTLSTNVETLTDAVLDAIETREVREGRPHARG